MAMLRSSSRTAGLMLPLLVLAACGPKAATEAVPDTGAIATAELNLAEVYRLQSRTEEAAPLYTRALMHAMPGLAPCGGEVVAGAIVFRRARIRYRQHAEREWMELIGSAHGRAPSRSAAVAPPSGKWNHWVASAAQPA